MLFIYFLEDGLTKVALRRQSRYSNRDPSPVSQRQTPELALSGVTAAVKFCLVPPSAVVTNLEPLVCNVGFGH